MGKYILDRSKDIYQKEKLKKNAKDPICASFAERLNKCLDKELPGEDKKLTQFELAEKTHVSAASISQYLKGVTEPKVKFLLEASRVFGVSMEYLLGETDLKSTNPTNQEIFRRFGLRDKAIEILEGHKIINVGININETINFLLEQVPPQKFINNEESIRNIYAIHEECQYSPEKIGLLQRSMALKEEYDQFLNEHFDVVTEIGKYLNILNTGKEEIHDLDSMKLYVTKNKFGKHNVELDDSGESFYNRIEDADSYLDKILVEDLKVMELIDSTHLLQIQYNLQKLKDSKTDY